MVYWNVFFLLRIDLIFIEYLWENGFFGMYGDRVGLILVEECLICLLGRLCGWGIGVNNNNIW